MVAAHLKAFFETELKMGTVVIPPMFYNVKLYELLWMGKDLSEY